MTLFLNKDLAMRFEQDMMLGNQQLVKSLQEITSDPRLETLEVGGGVAVYGSSESPINETVGLGIAKPVEEQTLSTVEEFYHARHHPVIIRVCPLAHPSLITLTQKRGYRLTGFSNRWVLDLSTWESQAEHADTRIRRAVADEETPWAQAVAGGFSDEDTAALKEDKLSLERAFFRMEGNIPVAGIEGGMIVSGGIVTVERGVASLFAASTLPHSRNRGLQRGLLDWRLRFAKEEGADIATVETDVDSQSQRNIERMGFRLAYTVAELQRKFEDE